MKVAWTRAASGRIDGVALGAARLDVGIELGTPATFFTLERPGASERYHEQVVTDRADRIVRHLTVAISGAACRIEDRIDLGPDGLARELRFRILAPSLLVDCVSRYAAHGLAGRAASIGDQAVVHHARNRYHQQPVALASIPIGSDLRARLETDGDAALPDRYGRYLYVRDEPGASDAGVRWVMHHRALAARPERLVLRGCHRWYNSALPAWLDARVPDVVKRPLYRIRERSHPRAPIMAVGAVALGTGATFVLREHLSWAAA